MDAKWVMRDGTKIRVRDMEDSHALNAVMMLLQKGKLNPKDILRNYINAKSQEKAEREAQLNDDLFSIY